MVIDVLIFILPIYSAVEYQRKRPRFVELWKKPTQSFSLELAE
jgi:hypothetical protein